MRSSHEEQPRPANAVMDGSFATASETGINPANLLDVLKLNALKGAEEGQ